MTGDQLKWTRTVNTDKLTVYRSNVGDYVIHGKGIMVGQRLVREWRLLRDSTVLENKIGRLAEAKLAAEHDYSHRAKYAVQVVMDVGAARALIGAAYVGINNSNGSRDDALVGIQALAEAIRRLDEQ